MFYQVRFSLILQGLFALCAHQLQEGHESVAEQISRDVSQLCARLAALWSHFLQAAVLNPHVLSYLAQEHHTLRVRAPRHPVHTQRWVAPVCSVSTHRPDGLHMCAMNTICAGICKLSYLYHAKIQILCNHWCSGFVR